MVSDSAWCLRTGYCALRCWIAPPHGQRSQGGWEGRASFPAVLSPRLSPPLVLRPHPQHMCCYCCCLPGRAAAEVTSECELRRVGTLLVLWVLMTNRRWCTRRYGYCLLSSGDIHPQWPFFSSTYVCCREVSLFLFKCRCLGKGHASEFSLHPCTHT